MIDLNSARANRARIDLRQQLAFWSSKLMTRCESTLNPCVRICIFLMLMNQATGSNSTDQCLNDLIKSELTVYMINKSNEQNLLSSFEISLNQIMLDAQSNLLFLLTITNQLLFRHHHQQQWFSLFFVNFYWQNNVIIYLQNEIIFLLFF